MTNPKLQSAADDLYTWFKKSVARNRQAEHNAQAMLNKEAVQAIGWRHLINAQLDTQDTEEHHGWMTTNEVHEMVSPLGLSYTRRDKLGQNYHVIHPKTMPPDQGMWFVNSHGGKVLMDISRPVHIARLMLDFQAYVTAKVEERQKAILDDYLPEHELRLLINKQHLGWRFDKKLESLMGNIYTVYDPLFCFWQACSRVEIDLQHLAMELLESLGYEVDIPSI